MKKISFRIFLMIALPLLLFGMGAGKGCLSGGGAISDGTTTDETNVDQYVLDLAQDLNYRAVIVGTVPQDATYTKGEIRVIADGGDYDNPFATETVSDLTPGAEITKTIRGLWPNASYKAKFFAYDEDAAAYDAKSNEAALVTTLKTITTQAFGHSFGFFLSKMESDNYWSFISSFGMDGDESHPDQAGILVIEKGTHPANQQEIFTVDPVTDAASDFDYNFIADTSIDKLFTFVCDSSWGKNGSAYDRAGKCYIFINQSDVYTESFSVSSADMQIYDTSLSESNLRIGSSFSYGPDGHVFLVAATGFPAGQDRGVIAKFTLDIDNKAAIGPTIVQTGKRNEANLGNHIMLDYNGNGTPDLAFVSDVDRLLNNTRCRELKMCLDSFDCEGTVLAQYSAPWCPPEGQGQATFWPTGSWKDYNGDGYDDVAFIVIYFSPEITTLLNIWWGNSSGIDPENVFEFGVNITGDGAWLPDIGDINGDGTDDLVILGLEKAYVYMNRDITNEPVEIDLPKGFSGTVVDFDEDGYADFVRSNMISGSILDLDQLDVNMEFAHFIVSW